MSYFRSIRMFNVESVKNNQSDPHSLQRTSCSYIPTVYFNSTNFCFYSCSRLYVSYHYHHYCYHIFCRFILLVSFLLFNPDGFTGKANAKCVLFSYNNFIIGNCSECRPGYFTHNYALRTIINYYTIFIAYYLYLLSLGQEEQSSLLVLPCTCYL